MNTNKQDKLKKPLFVIVYDELINQIMKGEYPVGSSLPSEPDLASRLGVSRATLRQALAHLQENGIVRSIHGKGNFVIDSINQQEGVHLEKLSNPMHKCHICTFDRIDIHYRLDEETEYMKQLLKGDSSSVVAIERFYRKGNDLLAYAFSFMSMQTVERLSLDLNNKEQLLDFLENQAYVHSKHGEIEIKYTHTVGLAHKKEKLIGQNECFVLLEILNSDEGHPLIYNRFYIPQEFSKIKFNIYNS